MLKFKKTSEDLKQDSLAQLRESFKTAKKDQEVEEEFSTEWNFEEQMAAPATRMVRLKVAQVSGCGCGGATYIEVERPVPEDSDLQDGDVVSEFADEDILL